MFGTDDETVEKPGIIGRADPMPLCERVVEGQLRRREDARVVEHLRKESAPNVSQKCDVTPAGSSYQERQYLPSSSSFANVVSRSGWNVSHITASSCVSVIPSERSASPGCGPCGKPDGCSVIEPTSIPLRDEKLPST